MLGTITQGSSPNEATNGARLPAWASWSKPHVPSHCAQVCICPPKAFDLCGMSSVLNVKPNSGQAARRQACPGGRRAWPEARRGRCLTAMWYMVTTPKFVKGSGFLGHDLARSACPPGWICKVGGGQPASGPIGVCLRGGGAEGAASRGCAAAGASACDERNRMK